MDPQMKRRWVEALTSGEYRQGTRALKKWVGSEERYCCLGVLCDLSGLGKWTSDIDGRPVFAPYDSPYSERNFLPRQVSNKYGLPSETPSVTLTKEDVSSLIGLDEDTNPVGYEVRLDYLNDGGVAFRREPDGRVTDSVGIPSQPFKVIASIIDRHF